MPSAIAEQVIGRAAGNGLWQGASAWCQQATVEGREIQRPAKHAEDHSVRSLEMAGGWYGVPGCFLPAFCARWALH